MNKFFKKKNKKQNVIKSLFTDPDNLSVHEFDRITDINNLEDLLKIKEIMKYFAIFTQTVKKSSEFATIIEQTNLFFKDLREDNIFTDYFSFNELFITDAPDAIKLIQFSNDFESWRKIKKKEPIEICKLLKGEYLNLYENTTKVVLMKIAKKIANSDNISRGTAIRILKEYNDGKYSDLFDPLNSKIRNSIGHPDCYWRPELKQVEFTNGKSEPIRLTLEEFYQLCHNLRILTLSLQYTITKIREPTLLFIMDKAQIVYDYGKKHKLDIKKNLASKSVIEIADDIEKGLI